MTKFKDILIIISLFYLILITLTASTVTSVACKESVAQHSSSTIQHGNNSYTVTDQRNNTSRDSNTGNNTERRKTRTITTSNNEFFTVTSLPQFCRLYFIPVNACDCSTLVNNYKVKPSQCLTIDGPSLIPYGVSCTVVGKIRDLVIIIISIIGICGNLLVVLVTFAYKHNLPKFRIIIGMLGFADLAFSVFQLVIYFPGLWTCRWAYDASMCKILHSTVHATSMVALALIAIIAIERYNGIVRASMSKEFTVCKNVYAMVCVAVVASLLFTIPMALKLNLNHCYFCIEAWENQTHSMIYNWVLLVVTFLLPIIATSAFYISIVKELYKNRGDTGRIIGIKQNKWRRKEDRRITSIIAYLLVSFVVFVSPNRLLLVLQDHGIFNDIPSDKTTYIQIAALVPYAVHSTINPFIYSIIDGKFRQNIRRFYVTKLRRSTTKASTFGSDSLNKQLMMPEL